MAFPTQWNDVVKYSFVEDAFDGGVNQRVFIRNTAANPVPVIPDATTTATLTSILAAIDGLEGFTDGIEGLLTAIGGFVDGLEGFTDGLEGLATAGNASLASIDSKVATEAKQDVGNASLASIDSKVSTAAKQDIGNASLASIDGKLNSLGQKNMAGSVPVVLPTDFFFPNRIVTGSITALNGNVQIDCAGLSSLNVSILGTFVSTQTFQVSPDGVNWYTARAYSTTGAQFVGATGATNLLLRVAVAGMRYFRVVSTAFVSGTVAVILEGCIGPNALLVTSENANNFLAACVQSGNWFLSDSGRRTYSARAVFHAANNATDIFTITGAAGVVVRVTKLSISATKTSAGTGVIDLLKRSTANTGGTSTAPTRVPHDSADAAATATVLAYTANPTLGTLVGALQSEVLHFVETTKMASQQTLMWGSEALIHKAFVLRGTSEVLAVNLRGVTFAGNEMAIDVTWTEE